MAVCFIVCSAAVVLVSLPMFEAVGETVLQVRDSVILYNVAFK